MTDPKLIAITGASGLIGRALTKKLRLENQPYLKLVRHPASEEGERFWNYSEKILDGGIDDICLLYTSPSPRDAHESRMPSSA